MRIGDIEIPCYVLEDGRRVLSQRGLQAGIGMSTSGGSKPGEQRIVGFLESLMSKGIEISELVARSRLPIVFIPTGGGGPAYGYEATILTDICDAVLEARKKDVLQLQQQHLAKQCEVLVRGFAKIGIIALVDEATGYQDVRARNALAHILEQFIAKELRKWVKTFPVDFYKEMFRLRGWKFDANSQAKPALVGKLTNDVVYSRLAPGILDELKRSTPRDDHGRLKHHYHRRLTEDVGHPKLLAHLTAATAVMKLSADWRDFKGKLDIVLPAYNKTLPLELPNPSSSAS